MKLQRYLLTTSTIDSILMYLLSQNDNNNYCTL